jgi:predicted acyl esterase
LPGLGANAYRLQSAPPPPGARVTQQVDLGNRSDIDRVLAGGGLVNREIDTVDVLQFVSEPVQQRTELSGLFSGSLDVVVNKRDFDAYIGLYELNANGEYFLLTTWQQRASHVNDLVHRRLLTPGRHQRLAFTSIRLTSRMLEPGSRIVVLIGPIKAPVLQINLGSGKEVSDETIADAGPPLIIDWFAGSYLELPIRSVSAAPAADGAGPRRPGCCGGSGGRSASPGRMGRRSSFVLERAAARRSPRGSRRNRPAPAMAAAASRSSSSRAGAGP